MLRLPRFFGKKRGHRRTGSQAWASLGDAIFHAILVIVGLVFGALLLTGVAVPEWRINHHFRPAQCSVLAKGLLRRTSGAVPPAHAPTWQPVLRLRYEALGRTHEAWSTPQNSTLTDVRDDALKRLGAWRLGERTVAWFDPAAPDVVVLERGYNWRMWLLTLLLPGALLAFGGAGLVRAVRRWGRSEERCATGPNLAGMLDSTATVATHAGEHPGVPSCDDLTNSPGTLLRYRLPIRSAESWNLFGFGLFALSWNSVLAVLVVGAGSDFLASRVDLLLLAFIVPFAIIGIAGIVVFVRSLVVATAVGTTQVEISNHPLQPGGGYDVLLAQGGSGGFRMLEIALELEEQATFRQGTDTRTERVTVWRQPLQSWRELQLAPGTRFEARTRVVIPVTAMHSFASAHNSVTWSLVVRGEPGRWPAFTRVFPLVVHPDAAASRGSKSAPAEAGP